MLHHFSRLLSELLIHANKLAEKHGVDSHKVKLLLSEIISIPIPALAFNSNKILSDEQLSRFERLFYRLISNEPIQYILGKTNFYGLNMLVNENVLIPRPETEGLVEWINSREHDSLNVLDIGTGSGALALVLKQLNPEFNITGTDISTQAVKLARINAKQLGLKVTFFVADLYPKGQDKFDLIVSNPPYVSKEDYAFLDEEIRFFEPRLALLAKEKGLEFYNRILRTARQHLLQKGRIYFEIGETQAKAIAQIAQRYSFNRIEIKQDLAGRDRYLCISK